MSRAVPISMLHRTRVYLTVEHGGRKLTSRQRRRIEHKRNHALAPFGDKK